MFVIRDEIKGRFKLVKRLLLCSSMHQIIISPLALSGCQIWSLNLREENKFMVFGNSVLSEMF